jgi:hypothetical protein
VRIQAPGNPSHGLGRGDDAQAYQCTLAELREVL